MFKEPGYVANIMLQCFIKYVCSRGWCAFRIRSGLMILTKFTHIYTHAHTYRHTHACTRTHREGETGGTF